MAKITATLCVAVSVLTKLQAFNSARFSYIKEGEPTTQPHICPLKTAPSLLLVMFLEPSFSLTGVCNSLSVFCAQHCLKMLS